MAARKRIPQRPLNAAQLAESLDLLRQLCGIAKAQLAKADHDIGVAEAGIESLQRDLEAHGFNGAGGGR